MKTLMDGIHTWHVFSEEKQLNFNGLYIQSAAGPFLVDPPPMDEGDIAQVEQLGKPLRIYLTNKHHTRGSQEHRDRWGCGLWVPEDDKSLMEIPVDGTFNDGELLMEALEAVQIPDAKTPGECAFHWPDRKVLIIGDAIIHKPGGLAMLPDEKFKDPAAARIGLRVLQGLEYDTLLVGDGEPILTGASEQVEAFIKSI